MKQESNISKLVMLSVSKLKTTIFRNNTGKAWQGEYLRTKKGDVLLRNPRIVEFGLCPGSSDLIGWTERTITPDMVGKKVAIFTALEVKTATGRVSQEQLNFVNRLRECGGIGGIVSSHEEAENLIKNM